MDKFEVGKSYRVDRLDEKIETVKDYLTAQSTGPREGLTEGPASLRPLRMRPQERCPIPALNSLSGRTERNRQAIVNGHHGEQTHFGAFSWNSFAGNCPETGFNE